jgi:hypothetical protein
MNTRELDLRIANIDDILHEYEFGNQKRAFEKLLWEIRVLIKEVAELQKLER